MRKLVLLLLFGSVLTGAQQFVNDTTYYTDANGRVILMINQRPIQKESVPIPILPKHSKSARTRYFENIQAVPLTADSAEIYKDQISSEYQEARHDRHLGKALIGIGCGASGASVVFLFLGKIADESGEGDNIFNNPFYMATAISANLGIGGIIGGAILKTKGTKELRAAQYKEARLKAYDESKAVQSHTFSIAPVIDPGRRGAGAALAFSF